MKLEEVRKNGASGKFLNIIHFKNLSKEKLKKIMGKIEFLSIRSWGSGFLVTT